MKSLAKFHKRISLIGLLFLILCGINNGFAQKDWDRKDLTNRVKSVSITQYHFHKKDGKLVKTDKKAEGYLLFSKDGKLLEEHTYKSNNSLRTKYVYKYDNTGKQTGVCSYNAEGLLFKEYNYEYDGQDRLVKESVRYLGRRPRPRHVYRYNTKGDQIEYKSYNRDGSLDTKCVYKYNDKGQKTKETYYNAKGAINKQVLYKYDDAGKLIKYKALKGDSSFDEMFVYTYNNQGYKIKQVHYNQEGKADKTWTYIHDALGNEIEERLCKEDGDLVLRTTYKYNVAGTKLLESCAYDSRGNLLEKFIRRKKDSKYVHQNGDVSKEVYKYDLRGNWVRKIEYTNNVPQIVTSRKIKYF